jgi:hypothetical protein
VLIRRSYGLDCQVMSFYHTFPCVYAIYVVSACYRSQVGRLSQQRIAKRISLVWLCLPRDPMRHSSFAPPNNIVTQLHVKIGVLEST